MLNIIWVFLLYICNLNSVKKVNLMIHNMHPHIYIQWRNRNHFVWLSHFTDSTTVVQMAGLWNQSSVLFMAHRSIHSSLFRLTRPMEF